MQKVLSTIYPFELELIADLLDDAEIPFDIITPSSEQGYGGHVREIWIRNEEDYTTAREIINRHKERVDLKAAGWICPGCGEMNDSEVKKCGNCQHEISGDSESDSFQPDSPQYTCPRCGSADAAISKNTLISFPLFIASIFLLGIPLFVHMFFEIGRGREYQCKDCHHKYRLKGS